MWALTPVDNPTTARPCPFLMIRSGVTTEQKLLSKENEINPDFYVDSNNDFFH